MTNTYPESTFEFPKQSLINRSPVFEIEKDICTILNADAVLSACGVNFYPEDSLQIEYEIKNAISKQGIVGLVSFDSLNYIGTNSGVDNCYDVNLKLQVTEQPTINRARAGEKEVSIEKWVVTKTEEHDSQWLRGKTFINPTVMTDLTLQPEDLHQEGTVFSTSRHTGGSLFDSFVVVQTEPGHIAEIEYTNESCRINFIGMQEGADYEVHEGYVSFLRAVNIINATGTNQWLLTINLVEHQTETETVYTYAITALEACIQAMALLADRESTKQFGTFCPVSMNQNSDAAFLTTVGLFKASYAMPKIEGI